MLPENKMSTPPTTSDLDRQYRTLIARYETTITRALERNDRSKIRELQQMNEEISGILEEMLTDLRQGGNQREQLVATLNRIQRDYNGLKDNTDTFTLLRRIREGETGATHKEFQMYLIGFFVICLGILAMVFFGDQIKLPTVTSAMTPASTAPLA
jgi:hypothetical protein